MMPTPLLRRSLALLLLLPLVACGGVDAPPESERLAWELVEVWRTGDVDAAAALVDPTAVYEDRISGMDARGAPEVIDLLTNGMAWAEGFFVEVSNVRAAEDHAVIEWLREGSVIPADGGDPRRFRIAGVTLIEVEAGRIVRAVDYADPSELYVAMGGRVVLPGGEELQPVPEGGDTADSGG